MSAAIAYLCAGMEWTRKLRSSFRFLMRTGGSNYLRIVNDESRPRKPTQTYANLRKGYPLPPLLCSFLTQNSRLGPRRKKPGGCADAQPAI